MIGLVRFHRMPQNNLVTKKNAAKNILAAGRK
jgi:hypothetical protein